MTLAQADLIEDAGPTPSEQNLLNDYIDSSEHGVHIAGLYVVMDHQHVLVYASELCFKDSKDDHV